MRYYERSWKPCVRGEPSWDRPPLPSRESQPDVAEPAAVADAPVAVVVPVTHAPVTPVKAASPQSPAGAKPKATPVAVVVDGGGSRQTELGAFRTRSRGEQCLEPRSPVIRTGYNREVDDADNVRTHVDATGATPEPLEKGAVFDLTHLCHCSGSSQSSFLSGH